MRFIGNLLRNSDYTVPIYLTTAYNGLVRTYKAIVVTQLEVVA